MKMEIPETSAVAISVDKKIGDIKQNFWFRTSMFALSIAGGVVFTRLLYAGLALLPLLGNGAQGKASPVVAVLKMLRSGFGN